jgi:hypothetical protein
MSPFDDFRRALECLMAAFEAVQLAPSGETIELFESASAELRRLHAPVLERAYERARILDERRK